MKLTDMFCSKNWVVTKRSDIGVITHCQSLIKDKKFSEAIKDIREYFETEEVLDIQLLCLYLQSSFIEEHDCENLKVIITTITETIQDQYERLTPENKREIVALKSIQGLLTSLVSSLEYYQVDITKNNQQQILENLEILSDNLSEKIEETNKLSDLYKAKKEFIDIIKRQTIEEPETEEIENEQEAIGLNETAPTAETKSKKQSVQIEDNTPSAMTKVMGSYEWQRLITKLNQFSELVKNKNTFELALLFDDIQNEINNFNPIHYFPEQFKTFLQTMNSDLYMQIQGIIEQSKGSGLWSFMQQKLVQARVSLEDDTGPDYTNQENQIPRNRFPEQYSNNPYAEQNQLDNHDHAEHPGMAGYPGGPQQQPGSHPMFND